MKKTKEGSSGGHPTENLVKKTKGKRIQLYLHGMSFRSNNCTNKSRRRKGIYKKRAPGKEGKEAEASKVLLFRKSTSWVRKRKGKLRLFECGLEKQRGRVGSFESG